MENLEIKENSQSDSMMTGSTATPNIFSAKTKGDFILLLQSDPLSRQLFYDRYKKNVK